MIYKTLKIIQMKWFCCRLNEGYDSLTWYNCTSMVFVWAPVSAFLNPTRCLTVDEHNHYDPWKSKIY